MHTSARRLVVVEDDKSLNLQLCELLRHGGYEVTPCLSAEECMALNQSFDLFVLDVMLPGLNGYELLTMLRSRCHTPIIMLSAKGAEEERIRGLSGGADDYVTKPFHPTELLLRIEAVLRRSLPDESVESADKITLDGLTLFYPCSQVSVNGSQLELTAIQFKLIWELALHCGEVLSKAYLYQRVLHRPLGAHDRSLDMHMSRVRRKLNDANWQGERLQTVHGKGYCLDVNG